MLVRVLVCLEGSVEVELVCEPVFDYGRSTPEWSLVDGSRHTLAIDRPPCVPTQAVLRSDVHCGHRVALRGIAEAQNGQSFVDGKASS